jgi:hypothetical protein
MLVHVRKALAGAGLCLALTTALPSEAALPAETSTRVADIAVGNTLLVVNKWGPTYIVFTPSGGWRADVPTGAHTEGTWRVDGERLCVTQTSPLPPGVEIGPENCIALGAWTFDKTWDVEDPRGGKLVYTWLRGARGPKS